MATFNTLDEVRQAVNSGITVHWMNDAYTVINNNEGIAVVWREDNGYCGGIIDNDKPCQFYTKEGN